MQDILKIQPHEVSKDLKGYVIGIYGDPGSGKTTTALQAPSPILAACEVGYKAIPNTIAFDVHSWTDMLSFVSQLKKPEAKERFETVVIDTLDELVFYAEEFVLSKHGASKLSDIPWGEIIKGL